MPIPAVQQTPYLSIGAPMAEMIYEDDNGNDQYICIAEAGVALTAARWQIRKLLYHVVSGTNKYYRTQWASGTANFDKLATDKATIEGTYTFS